MPRSSRPRPGETWRVRVFGGVCIAPVVATCVGFVTVRVCGVDTVVPEGAMVGKAGVSRG